MSKYIVNGQPFACRVCRDNYAWQPGGAGDGPVCRRCGSVYKNVNGKPDLVRIPTRYRKPLMIQEYL